MKIRRALSRRTKSTDRRFYRPQVMLPTNLVEELGWKYGTELTARRFRGGILLEKKDE